MNSEEHESTGNSGEGETPRGAPPPPAREPVFNFPTPITVSIVLLVAIFVVGVWLLPERSRDAMFVTLAFSPIRYAFPLQEQTLEWLWTPVTYSLLHGSWEHLGFNSLWLAAFGTPVMRRIGTSRYVLFWILSAAASAALHAWLHWAEPTLLIGASGVVSALMGAACRFAFPASGRAYNPQLGHLYPRQSVGAALRNRTVAVFIVVWLAINLLFAVGIPLIGAASGEIAWDAHIGGFAFGFFFFGLFDPVPQRPQR